MDVENDLLILYCKDLTYEECNETLDAARQVVNRNDIDNKRTVGILNLTE